jgi:2-polyprenyl-3-methyl-5-hydroxy-6-metoxy-1,4-benzoquinol methylase
MSNEGAPIFPPKRALLRLSELDFTRRTYELRELLDEPLTFAEYAAAMRDLSQVNGLTRGFTPMLQLVEQTVARTGVSHEPLHLVDYGCGHGDFLRAAHRWGARRSVPLRLTGIDSTPYAARLAREHDRRTGLASGEIHHLTGDLFTTAPDRPADMAFCSLVAHHLPDDAVVRLLQHLAAARHTWMLLDLRRSQRAAQVFSAMSTLLGWHHAVHHDGIVSFARAFSLEEWRALVQRANVEAEVRDLGRGRVAMTRGPITSA